MSSLEWFILRFVFCIIAIVINSTLVHFLSSSMQHRDGHFEQRLKRLGISLAFSHILSAVCLMASTSISLFFHYYIGTIFSPIMIKAETFILSVAVISVLFHMTCILVNDFKFVNNMRMFREENTFYLVVVWISTIICVILMFFVDLEGKMTEILSVVILVANTLLAVTYGDILRRTFRKFHRAEKFGCAYTAVRLQEARKRRILFLGIWLTSSFILFSVAFSLERLLWQQNHVLSHTCVTINSMLQGLIFMRFCSQFNRQQ